jgi:phosphomannomutase
MSKQKIELTSETNIDAIFAMVKEKFSGNDITDIDGIKIDFPDKWVHLRKSNTEPIVRIYAEAPSMAEAKALGEEMKIVVND